MVRQPLLHHQLQRQLLRLCQCQHQYLRLRPHQHLRHQLRFQEAIMGNLLAKKVRHLTVLVTRVSFVEQHVRFLMPSAQQISRKEHMVAMLSVTLFTTSVR